MGHLLAVTQLTYPAAMALAIREMRSSEQMPPPQGARSSSLTFFQNNQIAK
jgi:hypothetical protein